MRVLLFDPYATGHHKFYTSEVARELAGRAELVGFVSDEVDLSDAPITRIGEIARGDSMDRRKTVAALHEAIDLAQPDAVVHLYADLDLPLLARSRLPQLPVTLVVFKPCAHYLREFGSPLTPRERAKALRTESSARLWMRRGANHRLMALDEHAVDRWRRRRPDQAAWWPEPPPAAWPDIAAERRAGNVLVYGSLEARKGVSELCAACVRSDHVKSVTIAGKVEPAFAGELDRAVGLLRERGIEVELRDQWVSDREAARMMREASAAAVTYRRHIGNSRVLLEAAAAGTPVIATSFGLVGRHVREYAIGEQADVSDAIALGRALDRILVNGAEHYAEALAGYSGRYSAERREQALDFLISPAG